MEDFIIQQKILNPQIYFTVNRHNGQSPLYAVKRDSNNVFSLLETQKESISLILKTNYLFTNCLLLTTTGEEWGKLLLPPGWSKKLQLTFKDQDYYAQGSFWAWYFQGYALDGQIAFTIRRRHAINFKFELSLKERLLLEPLILTTVAIAHRYFRF